MALHYNISKLHKLTKGKPELFEALLDEFLNHLTFYFEKIETSINKRNYAAIKQTALLIKEKTTVFGVLNSEDICEKLILWCASKNKKREAIILLNMLKTNYKYANMELKEDYEVLVK